MLQDPAAEQRLLQHLPEGSKTLFELRATVMRRWMWLKWLSLSMLTFAFFVSPKLHTPQLRQSVGSLTHALQTGNFNAVLTNFGLDPSAGASKLTYGDSTLKRLFLPVAVCLRWNVCVDVLFFFVVVGVGAFLDALQDWANKQDTQMDES